jgi:signal recognition particle GTPase
MLSLKPIHAKSYKLMEYIPNNSSIAKQKYIYYTSKKYQDEIKNNDFTSDDLEHTNYSKLLQKIKKSGIKNDEFYKIRSYLIENKKTLNNEKMNENIEKVKKIVLDNSKNEVNIKDGVLHLLPVNIRGDKERIIYYISGASGCGKSFNIAKLVSHLLDYYKREHKQKKK